MRAAFLSLFIVLSLGHHTEADPMDEPVEIGDRRELFVDQMLIDRLENASLRLHEPISGGVAIRLDKLWRVRRTPHVVWSHGVFAHVLPGDESWILRTESGVWLATSERWRTWSAAPG